MNHEKKHAGKPSEDRRWMQYYPEMMLKMIQIPDLLYGNIWNNIVQALML